MISRFGFAVDITVALHLAGITFGLGVVGYNVFSRFLKKNDEEQESDIPLELDMPPALALVAMPIALFTGVVGYKASQASRKAHTISLPILKAAIDDTANIVISSLRWMRA